jgi:hypothetical protein
MPGSGTDKSMLRAHARNQAEIAYITGERRDIFAVQPPPAAQLDTRAGGKMTLLRTMPFAVV